MMSVKVTYLQPRNYVPSPEGPPALDYDGAFYESGSVVPMPAAERDRLSNWFLFESEGGDEIPANPDAAPPTGTVSSVGMGTPPDTDQTPDKNNRR